MVCAERIHDLNSEGKWAPCSARKRKEEIQTKRPQAAGNFEAGSAFESRLSATHEGGRSLSVGLRGQIEAGFGADFSGMRVHTGS